MSKSAQRETVDVLVAAFNAMDIETIVSLRTPDCIRQFVPESMGNKPQGNDTYAKSLYRLKAIFHNFSLEMTDILEDQSNGRVCLWLAAKADTVVGPYVNEYVWLLDFDESGTKIQKIKEFSDTVMFKEFFPKLQAAMRAQSPVPSQPATLPPAPAANGVETTQ